MYLVYTFINKIYKWLPIIMLCHCRDDRSFHTNGLRHPVCARCEGITIGFLVGLVSAAIIRLPVKILFLLLLLFFSANEAGFLLCLVCFMKRLLSNKLY